MGWSKGFMRGVMVWQLRVLGVSRAFVLLDLVGF